MVFLRTLFIDIASEHCNMLYFLRYILPPRQAAMFQGLKHAILTLDSNGRSASVKMLTQSDCLAVYCFLVSHAGVVGMLHSFTVAQ